MNVNNRDGNAHTGRNDCRVEEVGMGWDDKIIVIVYMDRLCTDFGGQKEREKRCHSNNELGYRSDL